MGITLHAKYDDMSSKSADIKKWGEKLYNDLKECYKTVSDLHNTWKGKRYQDLVVEFNKMTENLNNILDVTGDFATNIDQIGKNYKGADHSHDAAKAAKVDLGKLNNLDTANEFDFIDFNEDDATACYNKVGKYFENSGTYMDNIMSVINGLSWTGTAQEADVAKFKELTDKIKTQMSKLIDNFKAQINAAKNDIVTAENTNIIQD